MPFIFSVDSFGGSIKILNYCKNLIWIIQNQIRIDTYNKKFEAYIKFWSCYKVPELKMCPVFVWERKHGHMFSLIGVNREGVAIF